MSLRSSDEAAILAVLAKHNRKRSAPTIDQKWACNDYVIFAEGNHSVQKRFARASRPRSGRAVFAARWTLPTSEALRRSQLRVHALVWRAPSARPREWLGRASLPRRDWLPGRAPSSWVRCRGRLVLIHCLPPERRQFG